ncbi:MAG: PepSY domain-containing protein [Alphaproteobacteria bacterium]
MLKNLWFQLHWLLGITAGIVLAAVGVTGGILSFEDQILRAINPSVMTVAPQGEAPGPADLLARIQAANPGETVTALTLSAAPGDAARVTFAPPAGQQGGGRARGVTRYADPYTGALLGEPQGQGFFRLTMQIHRWLAAGDVGKQIVGASTVALIVLAASGLYLRWPRTVLTWRNWFRIDMARKGRNFLWELHSVIGTWVLVPYLIMSLTGLYWSYEWYRGALFDITGTPRPQAGGGPGGGGQGGASGGGRQAQPSGPAIDIAGAWAVFQAEAGGYSTVTLRLPARPGQPYEFRYQEPDPPHERANNTLSVDAAGTVREHRRYADLPTGQKLMGSIFPLHSGSFFGTAGLIVFMLSSLLMPLFAITGWMLYLDRRARKRAVRAARVVPNAAAGEPVLIGFASQSGTAERIAWQTAGMLQAAGLPVAVSPLGQLGVERLAAAGRALFVVSTFGEGEPPDLARGFARRMMGADGKGGASLARLRYGLLALGDRQYTRFCGFGQELDAWLRRQGAQPLFDRVLVDDTDDGALRHWQGHLGLLAGVPDLPDWTPPAYDRWRLAERRLLNPGSAGWPCYHIELTPLEAGALSWQAGDIAEIGPENGAGEGLPHREYSIASIPADGAIHLLVRRMQRPDGTPGLGSGWLTEGAAPGAEIALRIRRNPGFHGPDDGRPLLLIGNGTGIAGLRAHLKARVKAGHRRNWLIFGERNRATDFFYRDEIEAWQAAGGLARLDLAFSRDQNAKVYVQDRLMLAGDVLRGWVDEGASILVCGSLEGMAPAVDAALAGLLGAEAVEELRAAGRYRRDVY